jgi:hypothetical protein
LVTQRIFRQATGFGSDKSEKESVATECALELKKEDTTVKNAADSAAEDAIAHGLQVELRFCWHYISGFPSNDFRDYHILAMVDLVKGILSQETELDLLMQTIKNADLEELRELGSGTFGTVYHGKWRGTDVAIKRIKASCFAGRPSEQERLVS